MSRPRVRMPRAQKLTLFVVLLTSWSTGIAFFVLNRWFEVEGDFGLEKHPWQTNILKIHGGSAFLMMMAFGFLLSGHVTAGWKTKRLRIQGSTLVVAHGFLILSAYALYYAGGETFRRVVSYAHASVGVLYPCLLVWHLRAGRVRRRSRSTPRHQPAV